MMQVGIIGAGSYGEAHAQAMRELSDVKLVAASRTNVDELSHFVSTYGGTAYTDYGDLLADPQVAAVVIATPHHLHTEIALAAARAGKHILLEKPMAPTLEECDHIIKTCAEQRVVLMVGHVNHFVLAYERAKQILESGELGKIIMGISTMSKFWYEPNRRWWHLQSETGGGMLLTAGIHCLDRLTWLMDSPVTSVSAQLMTRFHDQQADDAGMLFLRYGSGAAGTIISTGYANGAPKHLTELTCTKGMMNIDYVTGVSIGRDERWQTVPGTSDENWMHNALVGEWRAFVHAVDRGTPPAVTGDYARHIIAVILAAQRSSANGREIAVTEAVG
ncbi:MAG: Gfo/Idh/MocA family oxidoreductase [Anaerolineae bacterium]|nr:Gfo/Idh/MocA family oxidoreductase [Anaerolineae bacterium]